MNGSLLARCTLLSLASTATAQVNVPIVNPGFEQPPIPTGTFLTTAPPPGWAVYGAGIDFGFRTIGVLDPATTTLYAVPAPEGENVGVVFLLDDPGNQGVPAGIEAGMEQTLTETLAPNTRYTLTVEVGNIANDPDPPNNQFQFNGFPGYRIDLLAGGVPLISDDDTLLPVEGTFSTSTRTFTTGSSPAQVGQPLGIRLVNLNASAGIEVNFDDVRLTALGVSPVPASGNWATEILVVLAGLIGAGLLLRRGEEPRTP